VQVDAPDLLVMGAREYSVPTGSSLSSDPLQILGGNWNSHNYAYNQPLQIIDPTGFKALDAVGLNYSAEPQHLSPLDVDKGQQVRNSAD